MAASKINRGKSGRQLSRVRAKGDGCVSQRSDTGKWVVKVRGTDGKWIREQFNTEVEALKRKRQLVNLRDAGSLVEPSKQTLAAHLWEWLGPEEDPRHSMTTFYRYQGLIKCHVEKSIGAIPLHKLASKDIRAHLESMQRRKVGADTCRKVFTLLRTALRAALGSGKIFADPTAGIDRPKVKRKKLVGLNRTELARFLEAASRHRLYAMYVVAALCGLREGELYGLQYRHFCERDKTLSVEQALSEANGKRFLGSPKTEAGIRRVMLNDFAVEALTLHRERMKAEGISVDQDSFIFVDTEGKWLWKNNHRRSFRKLLQATGLTHITFHCLRKTSGGLFAYAGVSPVVAQAQLGHADEKTTMQFYTDAHPDMVRDGVKLVDQMIAGLGIG